GDVGLLGDVFDEICFVHVGVPELVKMKSLCDVLDWLIYLNLVRFAGQVKTSPQSHAGSGFATNQCFSVSVEAAGTGSAETAAG
ncbi:MAG: hypothetical protein ACO3TO_02500, partial [Burkholderiaceae bacterium]